MAEFIKQLSDIIFFIVFTIQYSSIFLFTSRLIFKHVFLNVLIKLKLTLIFITNISVFINNLPGKVIHRSIPLCLNIHSFINMKLFTITD